MYTKPEGKDKAEFLYLHTDLTQQEIADIVGINRRTMYNWIRESSWRRAKLIAKNAPTFLVEQYMNQLGAINAAISARTEQPYPTKEESEIIRKLSVTIKHMDCEKNPVINTVSVFMDFMYDLRRRDGNAAKQFTGHMDNYIHDMLRQINWTDDGWQDYLAGLRYDQDTMEEIRTQRQAKPTRDKARKEALEAYEKFTREQADEQTDGKSENEDNTLTISEEEQNATIGISQRIQEKQWEIGPQYSTPEFYTGYLQATHNIFSDPHIHRRTTSRTGITIIRSASMLWGRDEPLFWKE